MRPLNILKYYETEGMNVHPHTLSIRFITAAIPIYLDLHLISAADVIVDVRLYVLSSKG